VRVDHDPETCGWCQFMFFVAGVLEDIGVVVWAGIVWWVDTCAFVSRIIVGSARAYLAQHAREIEAEELLANWEDMKSQFDQLQGRWHYEQNRAPDRNTTPLYEDDWRATDTGEPTRRL
jgi:hypothetical protein